MMLTELVYSTIFLRNCFPHSDNIHNQLSPRAIVSGTNIDYNKHCQLEYGAYVQMHEEHDNSIRPRTTGAIALRPMNNIQGGWYFMSLGTGRKLQRYTWTPLPMPKETIGRVHILTRRCHALRKPIFYSRDGTSILHDDNIETAGTDTANDDTDTDSDSSYTNTDSTTDSDDTEAPDTDSGDETDSGDSSYHTSDDSHSSDSTSDDDNDSYNGDENLIEDDSTHSDGEDDSDDDTLDRILKNDSKPVLRGFPNSERRKQHEKEIAEEEEAKLNNGNAPVQYPNLCYG